MVTMDFFASLIPSYRIVHVVVLQLKRCIMNILWAIANASNGPQLQIF